ncbi:ionotropic receptor 75a-like [Onthophagus taurus]|uniref:ionotropic receptor 75a-like n=1 Tax=Onthophagus taurus TaxID=166361 RepID=UPI0039BDF581
MLNLLILSLLLYNYYTSTVVSLLLNQPKPFIFSIDDLLNNGFSLGADCDPILQKYHFTKECFNHSEAVEKIRTESFAFSVELTPMYGYLKKTMTSSELSKLFEVDISNLVYKTVVVPKKWKFNEFFKVTYRKLQEFGIYRRELQILKQSKPDYLGSIDIEALSVSGLMSAFVVLVVGYLVAITILNVELIYNRLF